MKSKLIEDNMGLVYSLVSRYYPTYKEDEDIIQAGMLGLCKAADTWDADKSKFSTYAFACIRNEICNEIRARNKHKDVLSLDSVAITFDNGDIMTLGDTIIDERYSPDNANTVDYDEFYQTLNDKERNLIELFDNGLTHDEIGGIVNAKRSTVSMRRHALRRKWRRYEDGTDKN